MAQSDGEWGPWTLHNGRGCPLIAGTIAEVVAEDRFGFHVRKVTTVQGGTYSSWNWEHFPELKKIVRYREKRPKGMQILLESLNEIEDRSVRHPRRENA